MIYYLCYNKSEPDTNNGVSNSPSKHEAGMCFITFFQIEFIIDLMTPLSPLSTTLPKYRSSPNSRGGINTKKSLSFLALEIKKKTFSFTIKTIFEYSILVPNLLGT